jgi:hypothetical protein
VGSAPCRRTGDRRGTLRLNTLRSIIALMYRRHVYAEADRSTPAFAAEKQGVARRPDARFGSVAFVTGQLDPASNHAGFLALFDPAPAPILVFCGHATRSRSKAEMAALAERSGVDLRWVSGSLGLHEEQRRLSPALWLASSTRPRPSRQRDSGASPRKRDMSSCSADPRPCPRLFALGTRQSRSRQSRSFGNGRGISPRRRFGEKRGFLPKPASSGAGHRR